jgi:Ran-binding protein 1
MAEPEKKDAAPATGGFVFGGTPFAAVAPGGGFGAPGAGVAFTAFGAPKEEEEGGDDDGDDGAAEAEAECTATFKPLVQLEEVATTTGEEDEDILFEAKAKAYRFAGGEWKEKGMGPLKLLAHKENKKVRVLMRRDKTLKVCVNFIGACLSHAGGPLPRRI